MESEFQLECSCLSQPSPWLPIVAPGQSNQEPQQGKGLFLRHLINHKTLSSMWDSMRQLSWPIQSSFTPRPRSIRQTPQPHAAPYVQQITRVLICSGCCRIAATSSTSSVSTRGCGCTPPVLSVEHLHCRHPCRRHWQRWFHWQAGGIDDWAGRGTLA